MVKEWYSIREACEFLGVSESTIRRRIKDKKVIAEKVSNENGQQWFILGQSLQGLQSYEQGQFVPTIKQIEAIQKGLVLTTQQAVQKEVAAASEDVKETLYTEVGLLHERLDELLEQNHQLQEEVQSLRKKKRPFWQRLFNHS